MNLVIPAAYPERVSDDLRIGPDDIARCGWVGDDPDYQRYHDDEWGRPLHGDRALFEKVSLEGFQAGLSWITILRKRTRFREAFAGFEPLAVAAFGDADITRLMGDAGIVRNRAKIEATISNARLVTAMDPENSTGCCGHSRRRRGRGRARSPTCPQPPRSQSR